MDRQARGHGGLSGFFLLASAAGHSIDAPYCLFEDDLTGRFLGEPRLAAADRGERIRLLMDDRDTAGQDLDLAALDPYPDFAVRRFNPFANGALLSGLAARSRAGVGLYEAKPCSGARNEGNDGIGMAFPIRLDSVSARHGAAGVKDVRSTVPSVAFPAPPTSGMRFPVSGGQ